MANATKTATIQFGSRDPMVIRRWRFLVASVALAEGSILHRKEGSKSWRFEVELDQGQAEVVTAAFVQGGWFQAVWAKQTA